METLANNPAPVLTVFYDGGCPLCVSEIAYYQKRRGADDIEWIDVSDTSVKLSPGLNRCDALARFHVKDAAGNYFSGGLAFAKLWAALPAFRWLGRVGQIGPAQWLVNVAYSVFLPVRPHLQRIAFKLEGKKRKTAKQDQSSVENLSGL